MSLYGVMRTSVSGMNGQASSLSSVADNIANSDTHGYKRFETMFSSQVLESGVGAYMSGGINTHVRQHVTQQGILESTNSRSDLAISGNGFFVVNDPGGSPKLTRAGSFVPDAQGNLVNAAGFTLMGYPYTDGVAPTANGFAGLQPVNLDAFDISATPTDVGELGVNLESTQPVSAAPLPSANTAASEYTSKTSVVTYDNLGAEVLLDVYYTKTGANTWEMAVFDQSTAATGGGFPYSAGPITTQTMTFDPANGSLTSAPTVSVAIPNGATMTLDVGGTTQLASEFQVAAVSVNGNSPASVERYDFSDDGVLQALYTDGSTRALYKVPLATVASPDKLDHQTGNVFVPTGDSGDVRLGFGDTGGFGSIVSGALEGSNVDIAKELTSMIEAQRSYTANSKVFQTGSELTEVIINLKR